MELFGTIRIKWTYVTHRVEKSSIGGLVPLSHDEEPGRLVLARVLQIVRHKDVEGVDGRKMMLFPGDVIAGALGHRYATEQFEGRAVTSTPTGHLLGVGGVCGEVASKSERALDPTTLEWLGALADHDGIAINLRRFSLRPRRGAAAGSPRTVLVVGASMDAGKTTTAAQVIRSLSGQGRRVASAKITGTACRKDLGMMEDAGALRVLDFTDCGHASTAGCAPADLTAIASDLRAALLDDRPEFIVLEIADGILQRETRFLLQDPGFRETIDVVLYAATDSLACESGVRRLKEWKYNVAAVAGPVANSPLGIAEVQSATGVACLNGAMILDGALNGALRSASVA